MQGAVRHHHQLNTKDRGMSTLPTSLPGGTWTLGDLTVTRFGYGAMQLAGPGVMGPPADRDGALAVLREAVGLGITHIDTADAYGPRVTNQLIREALHPYPRDAAHRDQGRRDPRPAGRLAPGPGARRPAPRRPREPGEPSASRCSTWSTSGSATPRDPSPARSPSRSRRSSNSSSRA